MKGKMVVRGSVMYEVVHSEPWAKGDYWQPRPPTCFRVQGIDLKAGAYVVWVTNGVLMKSYLIDYRIAGQFLQREKETGAVVLDDSGIGLERILKQVPHLNN